MNDAARSSGIATNAGRLVGTRLCAWVQPAAANRVVTPSGETRTLPGQGGVVTGIGLGDRAGPWTGDHVEPGLSLWHPDPAANHALRLLSCAGNSVTMLDGPAAGARGVVYGKHGAVLAMLPEADLARVAPGERVAIDAEGLGLAVEGEPDLACHSCSPSLFESWIHERDGDGRLVVPVVAVLPAVAAAAGIGMPAAMFNMDLHVYSAPVEQAARHLRFGDIVAVLDQDHRYNRRQAPGWVAVGIVSHGTAVGGGHGYGLMTLLTAPAKRLALVPSAEARFDRFVPGPWSVA
jgi:hypothetical protein